MPPHHEQYKERLGAAEAVRKEFEKIILDNKRCKLFERYFSTAGMGANEDFMRDMREKLASGSAFTEEQTSRVREHIKAFRERLALATEAQVFFTPDDIAEMAGENEKWRAAFARDPSMAQKLYEDLPGIAMDRPEMLHEALATVRAERAKKQARDTVLRKEGQQSWSESALGRDINQTVKAEVEWAKGIFDAVWGTATGMKEYIPKDDNEKKKQKNGKGRDGEDAERAAEEKVKYENPQNLYDDVRHLLIDTDDKKEALRLIKGHLYAHRKGKSVRDIVELSSMIQKKKDKNGALRYLAEALGLTPETEEKNAA